MQLNNREHINDFLAGCIERDESMIAATARNVRAQRAALAKVKARRRRLQTLTFLVIWPAAALAAVAATAPAAAIAIDWWLAR